EGDIIDAIHWALDSGCRVISLSLGARGGEQSDPDYDRISRVALRAGCVIIAAAGDDTVRPGARRPVRIPGSSTPVMAVAAMTPEGRATNESNCGLFPLTGGEINLGAPGDEIRSAGHTDEEPYVEASGTSAAVPFVAGVAARILEREPTLTGGRLWMRLRQL